MMHICIEKSKDGTRMMVLDITFLIFLKRKTMGLEWLHLC